MSVSDDLVLHMRRVQTTERDLRDLGVVWQMIESSAAIGCPEEVANVLPTLASARQRFGDLQGRLIERMSEESLAELGDELHARAQCAIDILVRNLYERTADVGFLATDAVVVDVCAGSAGIDAAAMRRRLLDYQSKYSVYDDIVLTDAAGQILARIDERADGPAVSTDVAVAEALQTGRVVERFGPSDLAADAAPCLRYAHRVVDAHGRAVGVLVLRFRFQDEMARIFEGVADEHRHMALVLIDADRRVIATNDDAHVPLGVRLARDEAGVGLTAFAGREYVSVTCAAHGYQGYAGPGWQARAMVSLLTAFRQGLDSDEDVLDIPLDNNHLARICTDADAINRELRRVVWNGRLAASGSRGDHLRLKAVLEQVGHAGMRTRERVDVAIRDLYRTSLSRARRQSQDLARLAADILDRNLYERSNDCRWWAQSPAIEQALTTGEAGGLDALLDHVNGLYTVYSRLVVFDAQGVIRGASRRAAGPSLAQDRVDATWLQATRALKDSQAYAATPFEDTALHEQGPTWVFLAAVRDPAGRAVVGGVAVIFDAARELRAMLEDVVGERAGFAAFVGADGQLLASSRTDLSDGLDLAIPEGISLREHAGAHWACARACTPGYREFRGLGGQGAGVSVVVALRLGATERRRTAYADMSLRARPASRRDRALELAIFQVGSGRYALPADDLAEAVAVDGLVRTPGQLPAAAGLIEVRHGDRARMVQVMCARRLFGAHYPARSTDGVVLLLRSPALPELTVLGVRADEVLTVLEIDRADVGAVPPGLHEFAPWVSGVVDCAVPSRDGEQRVLVQLLDVRRLLAHWLPGFAMPAERPAAVVPA